MKRKNKIKSTVNDLDITLDTLQSLSLARKGGMSLFLAVFALRNT